MAAAQIGVVTVRDAAGAPLDTITETVLVRRLGLGQADFFATLAGDVMTRRFTTCAPEDPLSEVLATMHTRGLVPMLRVGPGNRPLGVVDARDGPRALLAAGSHDGAPLRNDVVGSGYR